MSVQVEPSASVILHTWSWVSILKYMTSLVCGPYSMTSQHKGNGESTMFLLQHKEYFSDDISTDVVSNIPATPS
jgi:hypothetical protein